jgi:Predicted metal-binding, possibly nucleic acid-binding protein
MENTNMFLIPISGLSIGKHSFQYEIKDDFFAGMDYSEVKEGDVKINLDVEKEETMMTLNFSFEGSVRVPCDRCGDDFDLPISGNEIFFIKFGAEPCEESENVVVIPADQHDFDLSNLIYEYIILSLPIQRVHDEGECNPEVLKLLQSQEEVVPEDKDETDPRWAALKGLKLD